MHLIDDEIGDAEISVDNPGVNALKLFTSVIYKCL
jgi:hypothetical protein